MFFAYNNGITATAQAVETRMTDCGASDRPNDRPSDREWRTDHGLAVSYSAARQGGPIEIFVQMKLSVIDSKRAN